MNQRESVYNAVVTTLKNKGINFEKGDVAATMLSKEDHAQVRNIIKQGFTDGTVEFKSTESNASKLNNPTELNKYVVGLVNNWLRKDPQLNGGTKYETKTPGSRPTDEVIKNLKLAFNAVTDETKKAKIQEAIDNRQKEIDATKTTKKIDIDKSVLPADIAALLDE